MEYREIAEIHDKVYYYLTEEWKNLNLRFTLRQKDRSGRLNKGYWFSGNDNYLVLSFWNSKDWRNKTPNIYFYINFNEKKCTLDFVSYDEQKKIDFFQEISESLGMKQISRKRTQEEYNHWWKEYPDSEYYIDALQRFIKQDKKIIDAFIISKGLQNEFEPVTEAEFNKSKDRVDKIRKKLTRDKIFKKEFDKVKSITISEVSIENISLFTGIQRINLHKQLTCFIGLNGTGKTSILRSIVLAFTGYDEDIIGLDESLQLSKLVNLLHISGFDNGKTKYSTNGFAEIKYTIENSSNAENNKLYSNKVNIINNDLKQYIEEDYNSDFENIADNRYKCLFLAFPQLQGEKSLAIANPKPELPYISDAVSMLNNQPDNRFGQFSQWLIDLHNIANNKQTKGNQEPYERNIIRTIFSVISEVTCENIQLYDIDIQENAQSIWVTLGENTTPILFDLVSQGYNNIFGWIGFFLKRLAEVTPEGADFMDTSAIVLIDEIDTYLHPRWQSTILNVLVTKFSNVQFIVTTHSPYVVGSIPKDKIRIYTCEKEQQGVEINEFTEFTPYGANLERLSEKIFGVNGRFVEPIKNRFVRLAALIHHGNLKEAEDFLHLEFAEIDSEDPELIRLRMLINTKKILAR